MDIFLCGPDEIQPDDWPPCPHPDVQEDGICCTCEHKVRPPVRVEGER